uniref:J domain-containing protein n=1 Tax=Corethron hystrix TaxID=216773 RepID=A0A7S1G1I9_9STRA|mmetsp:Transcript_679/g.1368  ORF Transcript_679/g.1368 Transcript_679/m.1368 type:complete len:644 (+) Transcript_679:168-2099(+)|eukprot:CAMPEP_0113315660 /NCGR_PEP_ID=MMETSP0010_2-20120614/11241_1 /TAXON_ID=216773 ORGANISM="Corethron hystrix, Strain 308" /NCGR_SAMPLE_ID=MMETSP0010_2 /ASSEMBLY_ACC=CAM_ASM_000155 /LENGTH=643 /DNA_ID=CAMNT_0000172209 /DNA_START=131 /DNA_END=2062 /DNA_ORIENTATION=- /assembly_acc=CAM_ASM_000155
MLEYDNSAFYYFALSTLSFYLFPSYYVITKAFYRAIVGVSAESVGAVARTSTEKKKAEDITRSNRGFRNILTPMFLLNVAITLILTAVSVFMANEVMQDGVVHSFDPYTILGLDVGAEGKAIKKAFRTKSLEFHPDKNPDNPSAHAMFMMIAKAYEALTDPTAKENYEKYGNPDGKQSLEVSIGLPSFLLSPDNRNAILLVYLIVMVVVIPASVYFYYNNSSKFGEKMVMYDSYSWYHHSLSEHAHVKLLPEVFAGSAEFRQRNVPEAEEMEALKKLKLKLKGSMQKPKIDHRVLIKGNLLLHSHLLRETASLSNKLRDDLHFMLKNSSALIDAMINICTHQEWMQTCMNCIEFGQYITQGLWVRDSSLMQLPHFTEAEAKACSQGKGKAGNLAQYLKVPDDEKKGFRNLSDEQKKDVLKCCKIIPNIEVDYSVYVDDDEDDKIYEGDLVTLQVNITRHNLEEHQKAGLVHAPHFPFPKMEAWWVGLGTREGKIVSLNKVTDLSRVVQHKIKFVAPPPGEYEFDVYVKSNAYIGLDQKIKAKLTTLDPSTLPEYKIHPDDLELDNEPTLFEEMMNPNVEDDSDSEDESESEDEGGEAKGAAGAIRELTEAEKKKKALLEARRRAAGDDSDSDDSDVEEVYGEK